MFNLWIEVCDIISPFESYESPHKVKYFFNSFKFCNFRNHSILLTFSRDPQDHPFKCSICFKSYAWKDNLNRHLKVHSEHSKYICKICNAFFSRVDGLSKHLQRIHSNGEREHKCLHCACTFKDGGSLKRHVTISHSSKSW